MKQLRLNPAAVGGNSGARICHFLRGTNRDLGKDVQEVGQHGRRAAFHPLGKRTASTV